MSLWTELAAEIKEAFVNELDARTSTFRRRAAPVSDLIEGTLVPGAEVTMDLSLLILPASQGTIEAFDVRFFDGIQDRANLRFAIAAAEGATFQPGPKDTCDLYGDGCEWNVLGCTPLNPDGNTDVIYAVGFRLP